MKKSLLVFATILNCFLTTATLLAQTSQVKLGPVLKDPGKTYIQQILYSDIDGFFALRSNLTTLKALTNASSDVFLERYNNNQELVYSKELVTPTIGKGKPNQFEDVIRVNNQFYLFSSLFVENTGQHTLYANKINNSGEISGQPIEVAKIETKSKKNRSAFNIKVSPDNSKIVVLKGHSKERPGIDYEFMVLTSDLKKIYSEVIKRTSNMEEKYMAEALVDNSGNVYCHYAPYRNSGNHAIKNTNHFLITYSPSNKKFDTFNLSVPGKTVTDITYKFDKNQKLVIAGLYASDRTESRSGTYFIRYDLAEGKPTIQTKDFDNNLLKEFKQRDNQKDPSKGIAYMKLNNLILKGDGSAILAAEQASWYEVNFDGSKGSIYHYQNNDALIVKINPDGNINWITRIPKLQHTKNDDGDYNSFSIASTADKIYLVYNEHESNLTNSDPGQLKVMTRPTLAVPVLVTIDNSGKFNKEPLPSIKDKNATLQPRLYLQDDKNLVIYGKTEKNYRFGNITL